VSGSAEQTWRGTDVSLSEVLRQLNQLRVTAARREIADREHIHPRNSVLDVIVISSELEEAERAATVVEELAARHPCRAVVVLDEPGTGKSRIDASVTSLSHPLVAGAVCQYEQVFLRVRGPAANHIPSLVDSLLIPDVVTYVWWTGDPPLGAARFRSVLEAADVLLIDSARFSRPYESLAQLAGVVAEAGNTVFGDFHWARLQPWREVLAQFFNPPSRRPFLRGVGALGIDYVALGRGNRSAAALFAGWLGSTLGWRLRRPAAAAWWRLTYPRPTGTRSRWPCGRWRWRVSPQERSPGSGSTPSAGAGPASSRRCAIPRTADT
jgi:glucose-6-phosphate dehydrogenase assembly protein OpcA